MLRHSLLAMLADQGGAGAWEGKFPGTKTGDVSRYFMLLSNSMKALTSPAGEAASSLCFIHTYLATSPLSYSASMSRFKKE